MKNIIDVPACVVPRPVNVVLIQPPKYIHSLALLEVGHYLVALARKSGRPAELRINTLIPGELNVVLCAHMSSKDVEQLPPGTVIYNSEALTTRDGAWWKTPRYQKHLEKLFVWDFSESNLEVLPHERKAYVPLLYCEELRRIPRSPTPDIDLLFYGCMNPQRQQLLNALQKLGVNVKVLFGVYGAKRDAFVARSRSVLNIHYFDGTILQQVRCFYPLINHVPIISERFQPESAPPVYGDALFLLDKEGFAESAARLLNERESFERETQVRCAAFAAVNGQEHFEKALEAVLSSIPGVTASSAVTTTGELA